MFHKVWELERFQTTKIDPDHAPFKSHLSSVCWDLTQPTRVQNLTTIASAVPAIWLVPTTCPDHAPFRDDLSSVD